MYFVTTTAILPPKDRKTGRRERKERQIIVSLYYEKIKTIYPIRVIAGFRITGMIEM